MIRDKDFETDLIKELYRGKDIEELVNNGQAQVISDNGKGERILLVYLNNSYPYPDSIKDSYTIDRTFEVITWGETKINDLDVHWSQFSDDAYHKPKFTGIAALSFDETETFLLGKQLNEVTHLTNHLYDDGFNHLGEVRTLEAHFPLIGTGRYLKANLGLDEYNTIVSVQLYRRYG